MDDTISLLQLLYRSDSERERRPAESPLDTAARVLSWAGDRLEGQDVRELVTWADSAFERDGIPPELRLSPRAVSLIERPERPPYPETDRMALLSAGLVERERFYTLRADLAAGRRSLRDLTRAEYSESQITDTTEWTALLIWFGGWIPVGIVAIVAGIIVAFISGAWSLFLTTVLGGTILGYVAMIGAFITYLEVDTRWLRLGQQERAAWVILLPVGPAVALLVAPLALVNA